MKFYIRKNLNGFYIYQFKNGYTTYLYRDLIMLPALPLLKEDYYQSELECEDIIKLHVKYYSYHEIINA